MLLLKWIMALVQCSMGESRVVQCAIVWCMVHRVWCKVSVELLTAIYVGAEGESFQKNIVFIHSNVPSPLSLSQRTKRLGKNLRGQQISITKFKLCVCVCACTGQPVCLWADLQDSISRGIQKCANLKPHRLLSFSLSIIQRHLFIVSSPVPVFWLYIILNHIAIQSC